MSTPHVAVALDKTGAYRKLIAALGTRAARMGSADPESAAQEAVRRSLVAPVSRRALEYFFHEEPAGQPPEWSLLQLLGWLHGVLRFVVQEERARARFHRETLVAETDTLDIPDPAPDRLTALIDDQLRGVVHDCLQGLNADYRSALLLRMEGATYSQIAARLGVNENTVATWLRRGSTELARQVRERLVRRQSGNMSPTMSPRIAKASHA